MILRYVYNDRRQLIGCVVRTDDNRLGYSAVHPKDRRKLTKKLARTIALGRAEKCEVEPDDEDSSVWKVIREHGEYAWSVRPVPARIAPHLAALADLGPKGEA